VELNIKPSEITVVYGGSFDPPHAVHQLCCSYALHTLGFAEVWIAPVFTHALDKSPISFEHRLQMCELLATSCGQRAKVIDDERHLANGYTIELLRRLSKRHPSRQLALLVGADILAETDRWHAFDKLVAEFQVVVLGRCGHQVEAVNSQEQKIIIAPIQMPQLSSTVIRGQLKQGTDVTGLIPTEVQRYITQHQLYFGEIPRQPS